MLFSRPYRYYINNHVLLSNFTIYKWKTYICTYSVIWIYMLNWRISQCYLLISAFIFKILIIGTVLTLASHNICLDQLLDGEVNWSQLVTKQRKRNDDSPHIISDTASTANIVAQTLLTLPGVTLLRWILTIYSSQIKRFQYLVLQYKSERIFIKYCSLVRW